MTAKNYVLDTNVLLHDPRAMYAFADNHVVIPIYVLEEIDNFKKDLSELGRNARQVARQLDTHRADGGLSSPVALEQGGTIRVALGPTATLKSVDPRRMDNLILELALKVRDAEADVPMILVTKDVNMRIRGDALGLNTVDYEPERIQVDDLYPGTTEVTVSTGLVDELFSQQQLAIEEELSANQFCSHSGGRKSYPYSVGTIRWRQGVPCSDSPIAGWGLGDTPEKQRAALCPRRASKR